MGFRLFTWSSLLFVVGPALWLIGGVVVRAVPNWRWNVLTTLSQGTSGGLENAIIGTVVLMLGVLVIAGTIGVLTGIHLSEFAVSRRGRPSGGTMRVAVDVLSGFPSIVLGYVGYVALCVGLHWGFSLLPALLILSMMVVPYIAKSTESALRQVPTNYREGAEALGMSTGYALRKVVVKSALPGIVTGLLIAISIAGGETAPLLYTAGWSAYLWDGKLTHSPVGYLTYAIWAFINEPFAEANALAYAAALLVTLLVLLISVAARYALQRRGRI